MKHITYICDRCKNEFNRANIVQLSIQTINCSQPVEKKSNEFCVECYNKIRESYENVLIEQPNKTEKKKKDGKPKKMNTGPMSRQEIDAMLRLNAEGKTPEEIANVLNRSIRGINRSLTVHTSKLNNENEAEGNEMAEEEKRDGEGIDVNGIAALAKAGWTPRQIAGEYRISIKEVQEILSEIRKKKA